MEEEKRKPTIDELEGMMEDGGVELLPDGTAKRPDPPKPKVVPLEDLLAEDQAISDAPKFVYGFAQKATKENGRVHGLHLSMHREGKSAERINVFIIERDAKRLAACLARAYPDVTNE